MDGHEGNPVLVIRYGVVLIEGFRILKK
jgi:hypothetical protein